MDRIDRIFMKLIEMSLNGVKESGMSLNGMKNDELPLKGVKKDELSENTEFSDISPQEWGEIFQLAEKHKTLPLIYESSYQFLTGTAGQIPGIDRIKLRVRQKVLQQAVKTDEFLRLNRFLQENGIRPLVVKGIVCRNLYPMPDHRESADEDLLVFPEQFERCHELLLEWGMQTSASDAERKASYEVPYRKQGSPLYIELHKSLFPAESDAYGDWNQFFEGVHERAAAEQIQGNIVYTFSCTDHFFYLICHAFKHFLHSGFGIRQVCDIIRYASVYGQKIDWYKICDNCKKIRAVKFVASIIKIGVNYLNFRPDEANCPACFTKLEVDEQPMLEDLLAGGVYGTADLNRQHSSNMTLDAVAEQKKTAPGALGVASGKKAVPGTAAEKKAAPGAPGAAAGKKRNRTAQNVWRTVFPAAKKLEGRYPFLRKYPWLLPAAWVDRLLRYRKETAADKTNSAAEAVKIGNQRIELLRMYDVIE